MEILKRWSIIGIDKYQLQKENMASLITSMKYTTLSITYIAPSYTMAAEMGPCNRFERMKRPVYLVDIAG